MRFLLLPALLTLAACSSSSLPQLQTLPQLENNGQWFKLEQKNADGSTLQTSMLAVEQFSDGIRFVQTDALGAPIARQTVSTQGWANDGFVMPNSASRRLFAAMMPLLAAGSPEKLYPEIKASAPQQHAFCADGGALFRYKERDLWCIAHQSPHFMITFPDLSGWVVSPIVE